MRKPAFEIEHRVEFHETDMAGIVHFSNFFRYMEMCEHSFARSIDPKLEAVLCGQDGGWPRVHASCDYRSPARFGDLLSIRQFVDDIGSSSVRYRFEIAQGDTLVAEGAIVVAFVRRTATGFAPSPIPEAARDALERHR